jgi:hypothetical protein
MFVGGTVLGVGVIAGGISALAPQRSGVPVIEASSKPVRERPPMTAAGAQMVEAASEIDGKPVISAAPETPALAALRSTQNPPAPPAAAPTLREVPPAALVGLAAVPASASAAVPALASAAVPQVPLPRPGPSIAVPASLSPTATVVSPPAVSAPVLSAPAVNAPAAPVAVPRNPPAAVPAAQALRPAPATAGIAQIQLAAVGTEDAAMAEWQRLAKKLPDLLGNRRPVISRTERDGKTYWRLRTSGFTDVAQANAFCGQLKSRGANCALATF